MATERSTALQIFELLARLTNNFQRACSCYRLPNDRELTIFVYYENLLKIILFPEEHQWPKTSKIPFPEDQNDGLIIAQSIWFVPQLGEIKFSNDGEASQIYKLDDIVANEQLHTSLAVIASYLTDPDIERYDPYHPSDILSEEETEADMMLEMNIAHVDAFMDALKATPLKPGIITPDPKKIPQLNN